MNKTLIGKNGYLFLINDACNELGVHCHNVDLVKDKELKRYNFNNFLLIVFPDKSVVLKDYLPDQYNVKYRPAIDIYKKILKEKLIDTYDILNAENDIYYKTDTHINLNGNYIVYKYFISKLNELFNLNISAKEIKLNNIKCNLKDSNCGIGDLIFSDNLGNQIIEENDKIDSFYFSEDILKIYYGYTIKNTGNIRFLNKNLLDETLILENNLVSWEIISEYILYTKNNLCDNKYKVVIFYDSFLLSALNLYLELFEEVYMIKSIYDNKLINLINPEFVFEFRVERFLF